MKSPAERSVLTPDAVGLGHIYAEALARLPGGKDQALQVAAELKEVAAAIAAAPGGWELLSLPTLRRSQRAELVGRIFDGRVCEPVASLLEVLARNQRLEFLPAIARQLEHLLERKAGRVEVIVRSAVPLEEPERRSLGAMLAKALAAEPVLKVEVDESLIAGLEVRIGEKVFDASLAGELERMVEALSA